jgi:hypothetical protein
VKGTKKKMMELLISLLQQQQPLAETFDNNDGRSVIPTKAIIYCLKPGNKDAENLARLRMESKQKQFKHINPPTV